jgi:hypothetical protein
VANLSDLVEALYPYVGDAPDELLVSMYRRAARTFFTDTRSWRDDVAATVGVDTATYSLTAPTGAEVFDFTQHEYGDTRLVKMTLEQTRSRDWPLTGNPYAIRIGGINQVIVMPDPGVDISSTLVLRAVLRPSLTAAVLPDSEANRFAEPLEYGALQHILRVPGHSWTDLKLSVYYGELFKEQIDRHTSTGADGNMLGVRRTVRYGGL